MLEIDESTKKDLIDAVTVAQRMLITDLKLDDLNQNNPMDIYHDFQR
jgi:hypothetical protein